MLFLVVVIFAFCHLFAGLLVAVYIFLAAAAAARILCITERCAVDIRNLWPIETKYEMLGPAKRRYEL